MKLISNLTVKLGKNSYKIIIDKNFPLKIKEKFSKIDEFSKVIVITDKTINNEIKACQTSKASHESKWN